MTPFNFQYPAYVWSEEYQVEIMSKHFEAFDRLRAQGFFVGEMIWNFADFKTAQSKYKDIILCIYPLVWRLQDIQAEKKIIIIGTAKRIYRIFR
jgi:hypothetical protein